MALLAGEGGGGASALSQLSDVELGTLAAGERLYYDGSKWTSSKALSATLAAGSTTVVFSDLTLSASSKIDIKTQDSVWYDEIDIDELNGEITLTFTARSEALAVSLEVF